MDNDEFLLHNWFNSELSKSGTEELTDAAVSSSADMADLQSRYSSLFTSVLEPLATALRNSVSAAIKDCPNVDSVRTRAKGIPSFILKASKLYNTANETFPKYDDPLNEIQDQLGALVLVRYTNNVDCVVETIKSHFKAVEDKLIVPDEPNEFGYEGHHIVLLLPDALLEPYKDNKDCPKFFELQIKTLYQYAWSEAGHNIAYKGHNLTEEQKKTIAFLASMTWGSDKIFSDLARTFGELQ